MKEIKLTIFNSSNITFEKVFNIKYSELPNYKFVQTTDNPDYIVATPSIYNNRKVFNSFLDFINNNSKAIRIFISNEMVYFDLNIFDYGIMYCDNYYLGDRVFKHPLKRFGYKNIDLNISLDELVKRKNRFCNFYYSNPNAHSFRDKLFYEISKYKFVDSIGLHLNNQKDKVSDAKGGGLSQFTRNDADWYEKSVYDRLDFKFSIACENAYVTGYTTEKIVCSLQAKTIPIYFGNKNITSEFNEKAFINCHEFDSIDEVVQKIKEIDNDDKVFLDMISQPMFTKEQEQNFNKDSDDYLKWVDHIFDQNISDAKRVPIGTWPSIYSHWFAKRFTFLDTIKLFFKNNTVIISIKKIVPDSLKVSFRKIFKKFH